MQQSGRYKESIERSQSAIGLFPDESKPYVQIAYALAYMKSPEAPEWALKAIAKQPQNPLWRTALSDTYTLRGKWKQAVKPMSEAIAMDPTNPRLLSMMGLILLHRRMPKSALSYLGRSLELDPTNAVTHQRMSIVFQKLRKKKESEEHLRKALELQPDNPNIQASLGWHFLSRGKFGAAEDAFYEALRINPTLVAPKVGLGAPASFRKGPTDIILRAALRLYSLPYRIVLLPIHVVLAFVLTVNLPLPNATWQVNAIVLAVAIWSWCYLLSILVIIIIGTRRGMHFV